MITRRADTARRRERMFRGRLIATGSLADPRGLGAIAEAVAQAVARIDEWTPKGVHFGWEPAFKNKGKFHAAMSKDDARALVRRVLVSQPLVIFRNRRDGELRDGELMIVADAGEPIGTRGQQRLRVVTVSDQRGCVIENAFPVNIL